MICSISISGKVCKTSLLFNFFITSSRDIKQPRQYPRKKKGGEKKKKGKETKNVKKNCPRNVLQIARSKKGQFALSSTLFVCCANICCSCGNSNVKYRKLGLAWGLGRPLSRQRSIHPAFQTMRLTGRPFATSLAVSYKPYRESKLSGQGISKQCAPRGP